jgi:hypothetical protein
MNELAEQFESRGVEFISITPEDAGTVKKFIQTHPMRGTVALDPEQAMLKLYGAGTPTTVLIDHAGRVARKVHPSQITASVLNDLALDQPVQLSAIRDDMYPPIGGGPFGESENDAATVLKISVSAATQIGGMVALREPDRPADNHIKAKGETLPVLLSYAYGLSSYRMNVSKYFQGGYYAVDAWVPAEHGEILKPLLRDALAAAIGYRPIMKKRVFDVLVLKGLPGKLRPASTNLVSEKTESGFISGDGLTLDGFRVRLEAITGKPVVIDDDDMSSGNFQWQLRWDSARPGAFAESLRQQLGVRLQPERRELEILEVTP